MYPDETISIYNDDHDTSIFKQKYIPVCPASVNVNSGPLSMSGLSTKHVQFLALKPLDTELFFNIPSYCVSPHLEQGYLEVIKENISMTS